ncbi:hypothetical protein Q4F19_06485 [Sphingomonas sp. BIUV-7]|uniref:Uncharacterized protein n=1 Tax=Sphingomonas natans TaxID=3063330 RepID=A0ABT8Y6S0_9SPHN|nr:hypothetical protein [Sphingomonas sp. BIUV-7]MDO6414023.1 hypothetical protein [Sphingomonas sp. BIUV-7]
MATAYKIEAQICADGYHRPKRVPVRNITSATIQTTCRDCGCLLVRTQATRRWFYSGPLA